jgi:hypothetical protein
MGDFAKNLNGNRHIRDILTFETVKQPFRASIGLFRPENDISKGSIREKKVTS